MKGWELGILECQGKTSEMMVEQDGLQGSSSSDSQNFKPQGFTSHVKEVIGSRSHNEQIAEPVFEPKAI